jgi:acyl carrier protein phosphodiesterase
LITGYILANLYINTQILHVNLILFNILMSQRAMLPLRLKAIIPIMIREDWLGSYRDLSGVEKALSRLFFMFNRGVFVVI